MIRKAKELRVAALIRQKIIDTYSAIYNSDPDRFNDRSPNWSTKQELEALIGELRNALRSIGAVPITAHSPCGDSKHDEKQYWRWTLSDGRPDDNFVVDGKIFFDGQIMETDYRSISFHQPPPSHEPCPCNPKKRADGHRVVQYFIWPQDPESKVSELAKLLPQLADAVEAAQERRTRSSIREKLLLALIDLERLIVRVTAEEEIEQRKAAL